MSPAAALRLQKLTVGPLYIDELTIAAGEILCLSGTSGSGKTRLLRAIADLDPHQGVVQLGDLQAQQIPAHQWRGKVMLIPAESHWWGEQVGDHFPLPHVMVPDAFGFPGDVMDWSVMRLSSGEKQRLALWRGLCRQPSALLLDEPTANLDEETTLRVEAWLKQSITARKLPTLWITHDSDQSARVANRRARIQDSRVEFLHEFD